jgi:hypothetical protein
MIGAVTSRKVRIILAAVLSGGALAAVLLFLPPPRPVLRLVARGVTRRLRERVDA